MKPHVSSLINAIVLIILGGWSYFGSEVRSVTALIPVFVGIILIGLNSGIKNENKLIAHIAVVLTLLVFIGLLKPLTGAMGRESTIGILRVSTMMVFTVYALITFIQSFITARKNK
ncbi:MAG: hypothetical protein C0597_16850 [Marinilabiliales bacterium]|nr:MAG: hypothetical protein C0597_16850 [Marinilabiliales bacterium]